MSPAKRTAAYAGTDVPVSKSQDELRGLLIKFGAMQFTFGEGRDWAGVEFVHSDHLVRVRCPLRTPTDRDVAAFKSASHVADRDVAVARLFERETMRVWRVLVWSVKARLVAVDEGLETFEQAFLSHLVDPGSGRTLWEAIREPIEAGAMQIGGVGLRALGPGSS